jgi:hypothetical protein
VKTKAGEEDYVRVEVVTTGHVGDYEAVTPWGLVDRYQHSGGTSYLQLKAGRVRLILLLGGRI